MENEIMKAMLEIKVTQLADDVARTLLMEEVSYEFMSRNYPVSIEKATEHMTKIYKVIASLREHQDLALRYGNKEVMSQCWVLEKPLYELMEKFRISAYKMDNSIYCIAYFYIKFWINYTPPCR